MTTPRRADWLGAVLLASVFAALLVLPQLGRHVIAYSGEARMALLAQDMIDRHVLFHARVEGQLYRNKPPLFPWSIALFSLPAGRVTVASAQLPTALSAIALVALTSLLGVWLFGPRAGLWAGLVLATGAAFFSISQQILPDMLMAAWSMAAVALFWKAFNAPGRCTLVLCYAALGLAVFSKGPVGLLPLLSGAVWLVTERGWRSLARLANPAGLAVFALINLAWVAPFVSAGSQTFGQTVLWGDWGSRYLGELPNPRRVAQFFLDLAIGSLPWTPFVALGAARAFRARGDSAARYALLSALVPLLVIIFSSNRQPVYLLIVYPPAALLAAWWADAAGREPPRFLRRLAWLAPVGVLAAFAIVPLVPDVRTSGLLELPGIAWKAGLVAIAAFLLGCVFWRAVSRGRPALLIYGGVALTALLLTSGLALSEAAMRRTQDFRAVAAALTRHASGADVRLFSASLLLPVDFYIGRQLDRMTSFQDFYEFLERAERPVVLMDQRLWQDFSPFFPPDVQLVQRIRMQGQDLFIVRAAPQR